MPLYVKVQVTEPTASKFQVNLSSETFRSAEKTHMKCELPAAHPKDLTEFFVPEHVLECSVKRAKFEE